MAECAEIAQTASALAVVAGLTVVVTSALWRVSWGASDWFVLAWYVAKKRTRRWKKMAAGWCRYAAGR